MDQTSVASYEMTDDTEYMTNLRSIPEVTTAQTSLLFANPVWGTETDLASTTFTPGVYLHNRDAAAYSYVDPHDTSTVAANWAKRDVPSSRAQFLPTASPTEAHQQSLWPIDTDAQPSTSSSSSSSYIMGGEPSTKAIPPPTIPGRVRVVSTSSSAQSSATTSGPLRPSRVSKPKPKPVGGSSRLSRNSGNSDNSQYQSQSDDQLRSFSSASSSASPPNEPPRHRQRVSTGRLSSGSMLSGGISGGIAGGLLTTGHGGNHNVTLRTASRKPKAAAATASTAAAVPKTESPNSDASPGSSPSSPDGNGGHAENAENLTSEERRARQNHNIVEKQYRNRLNSQFERLLSILPANQMDGGSIGTEASGGSGSGRSMDFDERRMSKAEVLDLARRRIHALENEIQQLYTDCDNLRSNVATLNMAIQHGQQAHSQQHNQPRMSITI